MGKKGQKWKLWPKQFNFSHHQAMFNKNEYTNQILCGHAHQILRKLPSNIAQCCITSPPYWGLRCYSGKQERAWGGQETCEHGFKSNICLKCGAYWGALGLELIHDCLAWAKGDKPCASCYICHLRIIFAQVKRVLRDDGTLFLNMGDCYATSLKPKNLVGMPWRVALALQADGYTLRSDIIYAKTNPMPESVKDRPTKAHEYLFLLAKSRRYYYDADAIREPHQSKIPIYDPNNKPQSINAKGKLKKGRQRWRGANLGSLGLPRMGHPLGRNKRSVWTISTEPFKGAHFATFPRKLVRPCVLAGSSAKVNDSTRSLVLDPFIGSGTVAIEAVNNGRDYIGIDISQEYVDMAKKRIKQETQ